MTTHPLRAAAAAAALALGALFAAPAAAAPLPVIPVASSSGTGTLGYDPLTGLLDLRGSFGAGGPAGNMAVFGLVEPGFGTGAVDLGPPPDVALYDAVAFGFTDDAAQILLRLTSGAGVPSQAMLTASLTGGAYDFTTGGAHASGLPAALLADRSDDVDLVLAAVVPIPLPAPAALLLAALAAMAALRRRPARPAGPSPDRAESGFRSPPMELGAGWRDHAQRARGSRSWPHRRWE